MDNRQMNFFPFGMWKSPISDARYVNAGGRLGTLAFGRGGSILLTESKDGRNLWLYDPIEGKRCLNGDLPVGGTVGYGGGDFDASDDRIVFAVPGRGLFLRGYDKKPAYPLVATAHCVSSPKLSPDGRFVLYLESNGCEDWLAVVSVTDGETRKLAKGADFYMQPSWSPDGKRVAWVEWNHPHMPWTGSTVFLAEFGAETASLREKRKVAGGSDFPADQPQFSPDGKRLSYIVSNGGFQDIALFDLESGASHVLVQGENCEFSPAAFVMGIKSTEWFADGERLLFRRTRGVRQTLEIVRLSDGSIEKVNLHARYTGFDQIALDAKTGTIAAIAVSPYEDAVVLRLDAETGVTSIVHRLSTDELSEDWISKPRELSWEAPDGSMVHGVYYAPKNPDFTWDGKPPAFVMIHGGPTWIRDLRFSMERTYFTTRGYGYLDVNYRGSTGYGNAYRDALNGFWGLVDVEDAIGGANTIGKLGLADRSRIAIIGGSAGGYTVLNALSQFPDSFKVGVSLFGVANLYTLSLDTEKLELHYNDTLVGPLPMADVKYRDWSPCFHADRIKAPMAIFQGEADTVVPLAQAQELVRKLNCPKVVRYYPEEGHGFRKPETNLDYIRTLTEFIRDNL